MCGNEINVMCNVNVPGKDHKPFLEIFFILEYNHRNFRLWENIKISDDKKISLI